MADGCAKEKDETKKKDAGETKSRKLDSKTNPPFPPHRAFRGRANDEIQDTIKTKSVDKQAQKIMNQMFKKLLMCEDFIIKLSVYFQLQRIFSKKYWK